MILAVITSCVFTKDTERVVTIDSNEKAFGCNSFEFIDSQTFKIDNVIYSLDNNHLEVTGYDKRFEGKARFISALNYHGTVYKTTVIDSHAFSNCKTLTDIEIPKSITHIGEFAFEGCKMLKQIYIPSSVKYIGVLAFDSDFLTSIFVDENNPTYDSREDCNAIIRTKDNCLIKGCCNSTIPSSVKSIGAAAFSTCKGLKSIKIPSNVQFINEAAFFECTNLRQVEFSEGLKEISSRAFDGCCDLQSIFIPASVMELHEDAFMRCNTLTSISVDKANPFFDSRENCNAIIRTKDNRLEVGGGLTKIPEGIKSLGMLAFENRTNLKSINIPASLVDICGNHFIGCVALKSITVDEKNPIYDSRNNCNAIIRKKNNSLISGCANTIIPNDVESIATSAFEGCKMLTHIEIPDNVKDIGSDAFAECTNLKEFSFPRKIKIIHSVFRNCDSLETIFLPREVTKIDCEFKYSCKNLKRIVIPKGSRQKFEKLIERKFHYLIVEKQWHSRRNPETNPKEVT